ncbi:MAG: hypothetical protein LBJ17_01505 [Dysgonamonadaceae bacterium]|nr:hypothetical protein [Dysgonamonadaceae bacterium]
MKIKIFLYSLLAVAIIAVATYNVALSQKTAKVAQLELKNITMLSLAELTSAEAGCRDSGGVFDEYSRFISSNTETVHCTSSGELSFGNLKWFNIKYKRDKTYKVQIEVRRCEAKETYCCKSDGTTITPL